MTEVKVSFIIPHKGREEMLLQTLRSIQQQSYGLAGVEIILISQNEQHSIELQQLAGELPLQLIEKTDANTISALRNLGVSKAKGRYLAFLDADIELSNNWLKDMLNLLTTRANTALVSAYQISAQQAPPLEQIRTALSNAELDCAVQFLPGRNLLLARESFVEVGGFPEHLVTCEDYFFTERVSRLGELYYSSQADYVHLGEDKEYLAMFRKEIWRGQSNLGSIKGRKIPLREWPSFLVPMAILAALLLTVGGVLSSYLSLTVLGLSGCCLPIAAYSWRLKRLVGKSVSLCSIVKFYAAYFPARALGTLSGALREVTTNTHN